MPPLPSLRHSTATVWSGVEGSRKPASLTRVTGVNSGSFASVWRDHGDFRGRDASYLAPPAQIRASPIRAHGSHLGCVTARRDILTKFRLCFSACDTVTRYCARPVLC